MNPVERNEILEMLAEGKITASEAISLLDNKDKDLTSKWPEPQPGGIPKVVESAPPIFEDELAIDEIKSPVNNDPDPFKIKITDDDLKVTKSNGEKPRWLKIRVRNLETGKNKVSVTLPLGLVSFGLGIARRFGAEFEDDQNVYEMWQMIKEGERGVLVDVEDEEDNEQVQIYLD